MHPARMIITIVRNDGVFELCTGGRITGNSIQREFQIECVYGMTYIDFTLVYEIFQLEIWDVYNQMHHERKGYIALNTIQIFQRTILYFTHP